MDILQDIKPLSLFKQKTAEFIARIKSTKRPTVLTINGNAEVVVMDAEMYQTIMNMFDYYANVKKISAAIDDVESGKTISAEKAFADFYKKHKI